MKVDQPTRKPTNKLTAAMVASALIAVVRWAFPALDDAALWIGLSPIVVLICGYPFRDKANVDYPVDEQRGV